MADDNDTQNPSADDALVPSDDIYNPARDQEKLEEDGDPPATPATDVRQKGPKLPPDHPKLDHDQEQDAHEIYDAGRLDS